MKKNSNKEKQIKSFIHKDASRVNIPSAEYQSLLNDKEKEGLKVAFERRNKDLDPQYIWNQKDLIEWSELIVNAPPIYIQEKIHPQVLIEDLKNRTKKPKKEIEQIDLFSSFNGLQSENAKAEFYQHDQNWVNRMILGDSLQVMASLIEREGLKRKVQTIYIDPPYGIKFNSNFQWSTKSRDVKDGDKNHITREPEQVKAFRDTWKHGVSSYLSYLRDRIFVASELLKESGSLFVQIGDENVHRVRAVLDEVMGSSNFVSQIQYRALSPLGSRGLSNVYDYILWYAKDKEQIKYRNIQFHRDVSDDSEFSYKDDGSGYYSKLNESPKNSKRVFKRAPLTSSGYTPSCTYDFEFEGRIIKSAGRKSWRTNKDGMERLIKAGRLFSLGKSIYFRQYFDDSPMKQMENTWTDTAAGFSDTKTYVVQTNDKIITRCILMSSDPGDLVLDPTCGSGTTAKVAEEWGRRWITIDTSRVALALARARLMGSRYPYYLLADSAQGSKKEIEISGKSLFMNNFTNNISNGFLYQRVSKITLGSIAHNKEIDNIWDASQKKLEEIISELDKELNNSLKEWDIPKHPSATWNNKTKNLHEQFWKIKEERQIAIDKSITSKAEYENLYDKPFKDNLKVRVTGPFTVESLSPHRNLIVNDDDTITDPQNELIINKTTNDFTNMIIETMRIAGVQQTSKSDKITFNSLEYWPGNLIAAKGQYQDSKGTSKTAGIFIGPEFGTVSRIDLIQAAKECANSSFDTLISCAFNYEAQSADFHKLGQLPVLKARMNADLHMQKDLKNTGKGNLFVVFGEPDINILELEGDLIKVVINGVDIFDPRTGEFYNDEPENIACWFIDSDYNGESFFVRQAYFLGQNNPYKNLKRSLKSEIDEEAWSTLNSSSSVSFRKPKNGAIGIKVINHLGDEVMKVYSIK